LVSALLFFICGPARPSWPYGAQPEVEQFCAAKSPADPIGSTIAKA
jgi:hypothetical protein